MSLKLRDIVGNIFHTKEKEETESNNATVNAQKKVNQVYGTNPTNSFNPFLRRNGKLVNPYIDYQKVLDNPNVSSTIKGYIKSATGLTPTVTKQISNKLTTNRSGINTTVASNNTNVKTTSKVSNTGNTIADAAQKYIGTPYVWGGESMDEGGMDCSGFVYNALKDAGHNVGRTTAQGYRNQGTVVSKSEMQPGDLIFYGKNGEASHIGIYIGNGQMIHSAGGSKNTKSNPGKGVSVISVDHRGDFLEARRY